MSDKVRDYGACEHRVRERLYADEGQTERMMAVVDVLWEHLQSRDVAWLGFYEITETRDAMLLRVCKPRPACSPIGLQGVCGKAWRAKASEVVDDVHALGAEHIVCDPANLSEVVVPCLSPDGTCWGVLDLDSRALSAFTQDDAQGLRLVLLAAGLTT